MFLSGTIVQVKMRKIKRKMAPENLLFYRGKKEKKQLLDALTDVL